METSTLMKTSFEYYEHESEDFFYNYELDNKRSKPEDRHTEDRHMEATIILSIVILLSLIGNVIVVVTSVFCMRLRTLTSIFILNLALSDLLFTVGLMFTYGQVFRVYGWSLSLRDIECKVVHYIFSAGYYSSIAYLVLMSVRSYMAVVHPHSDWKKGCRVTCILCSAWVVSFLAAFPVTVHVEAAPYSGICTGSSIHAHVAIMCEHYVVFVGAFLLVAFCCIRILQTTIKSPTNLTHRTKHPGLTFILVVTFFIFWAPYNMVNFLYSMTYQQFNKSLLYSIYICHLLAFTRCCLNPVIYGLFGVRFRKEIREIFQRRETPNPEQVGMEECDSNRSV